MDRSGSHFWKLPSVLLFVNLSVSIALSPVVAHAWEEQIDYEKPHTEHEGDPDTWENSAPRTEMPPASAKDSRSVLMDPFIFDARFLWVRILLDEVGAQVTVFLTGCGR